MWIILYGIYSHQISTSLSTPTFFHSMQMSQWKKQMVEKQIVMTWWAYILSGHTWPITVAYPRASVTALIIFDQTAFPMRQNVSHYVKKEKKSENKNNNCWVTNSHELTRLHINLTLANYLHMADSLLFNIHTTNSTYFFCFLKAIEVKIYVFLTAHDINLVKNCFRQWISK